MDVLVSPSSVLCGCASETYLCSVWWSAGRQPLGNRFAPAVRVVAAPAVWRSGSALPHSGWPGACLCTPPRPGHCLWNCVPGVGSYTACTRSSHSCYKPQCISPHDECCIRQVIGKMRPSFYFLQDTCLVIQRINERHSLGGLDKNTNSPFLMDKKQITGISMVSCTLPILGNREHPGPGSEVYISGVLPHILTPA